MQKEKLSSLLSEAFAKEIAASLLPHVPAPDEVEPAFSEGDILIQTFPDLCEILGYIEFGDAKNLMGEALITFVEGGDVEGLSDLLYFLGLSAPHKLPPDAYTHEQIRAVKAWLKYVSKLCDTRANGVWIKENDINRAIKRWKKKPKGSKQAG